MDGLLVCVYGWAVSVCMDGLSVCVYGFVVYLHGMQMLLLSDPVVSALRGVASCAEDGAVYQLNHSSRLTIASSTQLYWSDTLS